MNKHIKSLAVILSVVMILSLFACADKEKTTTVETTKAEIDSTKAENVSSNSETTDAENTTNALETEVSIPNIEDGDTTAEESTDETTKNNAETTSQSNSVIIEQEEKIDLGKLSGKEAAELLLAQINLDDKMLQKEKLSCYR